MACAHHSPRPAGLTLRTVPPFSADRYPTGVDGCAWLNWIADRTHEDDLAVVKAGINTRINSMSTSEWEGIGNGIITSDLISTINDYITGMECERDAVRGGGVPKSIRPSTASVPSRRSSASHPDPTRPDRRWWRAARG